MRRSLQLLVLCSLVATPALAQRRVPPAIDRGSLVLGGSASISRRSSSVELDGQDLGDGPSITSVSLAPSLLYFVRPGLAIGGQAGFSFSDIEDADDVTSYGVGPAVRAYLARGETRTLPYVGASVQFGRTAFDPQSGPTRHATQWAVEGVAGVTWLLSRQVGILGEAFATREQQSRDEVGGRTDDLTSTSFGLRFGVAAFLPRER